jgi:hypothetical protein
MNKLIIAIAILLCSLDGIAQQIPSGICGIVYLYDANGARVKRVYFCNNGVDPYPTARINEESFVDGSSEKGGVQLETNNNSLQKTKTENASFQTVDALYPNPTTGQFSILFSNKIVNGTYTITDINGKIVQKAAIAGKTIAFDISNLAAGIYFVNIWENGKIITKKVVKQ